MKIAAGAVQDTGLGLQEEAVSQEIGYREPDRRFRELMEEEMKQENQLAELKKENELQGLSEVDKRMRMQVQSPGIITIHRRIMPDGSYLVSEMKGTTLVSHYRKRLVSTSVPSKTKQDP